MPDSEQLTVPPADAPSPAAADPYSDDLVLVEAVRRHGAEQHAGRLRDLAEVAGSPRSAKWAEFVDRYPPTLRTHDAHGERIDEVEYHPAWHRLLQAGMRGGLAATAWAQDHTAQPHTARAAALLIWSQTELSHVTALSSTYAVAPALGANESLAAEWLPRLASRTYESALRPVTDKLGATAGLAVTERAGGTDLRATTTVARPEDGGGSPSSAYRLTGHKWFVSAPMSDAFLVLAQAPGGLTTFLVPRVLPDGRRNPWRLQRLKPTLGTRALGVAEVELDNSWGVRVGDEGRGLRTLAVATTSLRRDGVVSAAGLMRTCVVRAVRHARGRRVFGSALVDKPLMQNVLADLAVESEAATLLALRLAAAVDAGEQDLLRVAVPVAKYWVGKRVPMVAAEALECLGGNGYVEEHGLARVFRAAVLPSLWEGPGNVTALDVLRAMSLQPRAMEVLLGEIDRARGADPRLDRAMDDVAAFLQAAAREARRDPAAVEAGARWMVERLAIALQASLVVRCSPSVVSTAYLATRVAGAGGFLAGTLPVGRRTTEAIVERALPA
ncbi:MAG: acyl-CoA dehydrogenase family protein [Kineosporiaceae bacterium]|nr:acyl-CoA dehydrogenase family protein [Kineosporiaceae bacterium]